MHEVEIDKRTISYYSIVELIADHYARKQDLSDEHFDHLPNQDYGHPCTTERWSYMQRYIQSIRCVFANLTLRKASDRSRRHPVEKYRLIPISAYIDEYRAWGTRTKNVNAMYAQIMNQSTQVLEKSTSRMMLGILPPRVDALKALEHVVVKELRRLEKGVKIYFAADNEQIQVYGSLYQFVGDHLAQAEVAGQSYPS